MEAEIEIHFDEARSMGFEADDLELMEEELDPEVEEYEVDLQDHRHKALSIEEAMQLGTLAI